jgi:hypothetical protein
MFSRLAIHVKVMVIYEQHKPYRLPVGGEFPRTPEKAKESTQ